MKSKSLLAKPYAGLIYKGIKVAMSIAIEDKEKIFREMLKVRRNTRFGHFSHLKGGNNLVAYVQAVGIKAYEALNPWIEKIKERKQKSLWKGKSIYFAKASGTTSGTK